MQCRFFISLFIRYNAFKGNPTHETNPASQCFENSNGGTYYL